MADSRRVSGEWVMCHQCQHQWRRSEGGLVCPNCEGDFTEIIESPPPREQSPPLELPPASSARSLSPFPSHPFQNHNPWHDAPDPEEDDITTFEFNTGGGGHGTFSFSTRTYRTGGNPRNTGSRVSPNESLLSGLFPFAANRSPGVGGFTATGNMFPQDSRNPPPMGNFTDLLGMMLNMNPNVAPNQAGAGQPSHPFTLLSQLFNPANARHGDAVFSQEAFDRVMTQLMEQNGGSTAPGPASESAIEALPTKRVEEDMLGSDGKAECSICMDSVDIGEEVTPLPCNHWFHRPCVSAWLKEHDTCPHCRKSITELGQPSQAGTAQRQSSRRSSSVASQRSPGPDGSRHSPYTIPDSPSDLRQARQQYYSSSRESGDLERPRSHRHSSHSESRYGNGHNSRSGSGGSGNSAGGVGGWIRNHLPFQG